MTAPIIDPVAINLRRIGFGEQDAGRVEVAQTLLQAATYIERMRLTIHETRADVLDEAALLLTDAADHVRRLNVPPDIAVISIAAVCHAASHMEWTLLGQPIFSDQNMLGHDRDGDYGCEDA